MTNVRAKLTEAISSAQAFGGRESLSADNLADVLLSLEGVAIVALPTRVGSRWPVDDEDDFAVSTVELVRASDAFAATPCRHPGCKVEWGSVELNLCTRDARALAAALLAAADAAEAVTR